MMSIRLSLPLSQRHICLSHQQHFRSDYKSQNYLFLCWSYDTQQTTVSTPSLCIATLSTTLLSMTMLNIITHSKTTLSIATQKMAVRIMTLNTGNTKGGSITVPLTSCLTGLDQSVLKIKTKIKSSHTADSKPVKQEVNSTMILPPLVFPAQHNGTQCNYTQCYEYQDNVTLHNMYQNNETHQNNTRHDTQHRDTHYDCSYAECIYAEHHYTEGQFYSIAISYINLTACVMTLSIETLIMTAVIKLTLSIIIHSIINTP